MSIGSSGTPPVPPSGSGSASNNVANIWREVVTTKLDANQQQAQWKVGESMDARVQSILSATGGSGAQKATLNIGGQLVEVATNLPLKAGDWVRVTIAEAQKILLEPSTKPAPTPGQPGQTAPTTLQEALMRVMPFQGKLAETLGKVLQLPEQALSADARQALQQLKQALPQRSEVLSPEGLKQALKSSGAFSEHQWSRLALDKAALPGGREPTLPASAQIRDLKYSLLQLYVALSRAPQANGNTGTQPQATWQPPGSPLAAPLQFPHPGFLQTGNVATRKEELTTGEALKLLAQALSRVQTTQLNSVQHRQPGPDGLPVNTWLLEVPVMAPNQQINLFQMRIDEEPERKESTDSERKQESVWRITLSFDLEPLGPMYSLVRIQRGKVSSTFWAEQDSTKNLLDRELPQLRKALVNLGLDVENLDCMKGQPSFTKTKLETRLIDVRT